jgi:hypothetical protein
MVIIKKTKNKQKQKKKKIAVNTRKAVLLFLFCQSQGVRRKEFLLQSILKSKYILLVVREGIQDKITKLESDQEREAREQRERGREKDTCNKKHDMHHSAE